MAVDAQVVATLWIERKNGRRVRRRRGEIIAVSAEEFKAGEAAGLLRAPSEAPLPGPNHAAAVTHATEPDGTPLEDVPVGVPAAGEGDGSGTPSTHAEADEQAAELGISFAKKTSLGDKIAAIAQVRAAQASGEPVLSTEDLAELDDDALRARGLEVGLSEADVDVERDALLLVVAEAVGRRRELEQE